MAPSEVVDGDSGLKGVVLHTPEENGGLANFVSFTAIVVAAMRIAEGRHKAPILQDPLLSDLLSSSAGVEEAVRGFEEQVALQEAEQGVPHVSTFCAVRMRYVDDQLLDWLRGAAPLSPGSPVARQVVMLGAGLDTRAWRLPLPDSTAFFEVDQPDMVGFKRERLRASGAQTEPHAAGGLAAKYPLRAASWAGVGVDLMHPGWADLLLAAGFRPGVPTAWVAEGLLYYLSPEAVAALLKTLSILSAPGSALIATSINEPMHKGSQRTLKTGEFLQNDQQKRFNSAFKWGMPDDVAGYLAPLGWHLADKGLATIEVAHKALGVTAWYNAGMEAEKKHNEGLYGPISYYILCAQLLSGKASEAARSA